MLTLDSKFADFIALCAKNGACSAKGEAIPVMEEADKGVGMPSGGTCAKGFTLYRDGEKFPESWAYWVIEKVGKELDEKCRRYFIDKITDPMGALQLLTRCDFLSEAEHTLLKAKYEGKLPTAEKEVQTGVVTLCSAKVG